MELIETKLKQLPQNLQEEVVDFIDFLLTKKVSPTHEVAKKRKKLRLNWIGGLKNYRKEYTAIELQKKALEWRD